MLRKAVNLVTLAHYVLMNKNTPVLSFDYDLDDHKAVRIREVFAPEAAPFGLVDRRGDISKAGVELLVAPPRHSRLPRAD